MCPLFRGSGRCQGKLDTVVFEMSVAMPESACFGQWTWGGNGFRCVGWGQSMWVLTVWTLMETMLGKGFALGGFEKRAGYF